MNKKIAQALAEQAAGLQHKKLDTESRAGDIQTLVSSILLNDTGFLAKDVHLGPPRSEQFGHYQSQLSVTLRPANFPPVMVETSLNYILKSDHVLVGVGAGEPKWNLRGTSTDREGFIEALRVELGNDMERRFMVTVRG